VLLITSIIRWCNSWQEIRRTCLCYSVEVMKQTAKLRLPLSGALSSLPLKEGIEVNRGVCGELSFSLLSVSPRKSAEESVGKKASDLQGNDKKKKR
jgi:hypothetical protein